MYIGDRAARWDTGMILLWNSDNGSRYIAAGQVWNPRYDRDGRAAVHRRVRCRLTRGVLRYSEGAVRLIDNRLLLRCAATHYWAWPNCRERRAPASCNSGIHSSRRRSRGAEMDRPATASPSALRTSTPMQPTPSSASSSS